ncbi:hypothetical protein [Paenibacillus sp. FSL H8-0259]|nr:hypothetical protein [Paenibacillus sp. FSL H8-0259]
MTGFKGVQLIPRCMPFYCCLEQHTGEMADYRPDKPGNSQRNLTS